MKMSGRPSLSKSATTAPRVRLDASPTPELSDTSCATTASAAAETAAARVGAAEGGSDAARRRTVRSGSAAGFGAVLAGAAAAPGQTVSMLLERPVAHT